MAILRPFLVFFGQLLSCLSQNWRSDGHFEVLMSKSELYQKLWYTYYWLRYLFSCLQKHDFRGTLWNKFLIPQNRISSHIFKIACTEIYYTSFQRFWHDAFEIWNKNLSKKLYQSHSGALFLLWNSVHQTLLVILVPWTIQPSGQGSSLVK